MKRFKKYLKEFLEINNNFDWGSDPKNPIDKKFKRKSYNSIKGNERSTAYFIHKDVYYSVDFTYFFDNKNETSVDILFWPLDGEDHRPGFQSASEVFNKVFNIIIIFLNHWEPNFIEFNGATDELQQLYFKFINNSKVKNILSINGYEFETGNSSFIRFKRNYLK